MQYLFVCDYSVLREYANPHCYKISDGIYAQVDGLD